MKVELLWFDGCPGHRPAREMLTEVLAEFAPGTPIEDIDVSDPTIAERLRSPGSPTIRVDGQDIQPGFVDPGDYTPRCRVFPTAAGLRGVPPRDWVEEAIRASTRAG